MPQRFLKPGLTTSLRFNACSYDAQSCYVRILTLVDDYGRYEADPRLLRSHCFPFGDSPNSNDIPLQTMENICEQLQTNDLICLYEADDGKKYLQVSRWKEKARASVSKYPPAANNGSHDENKCSGDDSKCSVSSSSSSSSPSPSSSPSSSIITHTREAVDDDAIQWGEARILLGNLSAKVFNNPIPEATWRNSQKDEWLGKAVPIARTAWAALDWLYGLSETHPALRKTQRRQSFEKLLEHLQGELEKAVTVRKQLGLDRSSRNGSAEAPAPDGWMESARDLWGLDVEIPPWSMMPETARAEVRGEIVKKKERAGE